MAEAPKIIFGIPSQRPSPLGLKGSFFVDFVTPALYFSVDTSWVAITNGIPAPAAQFQKLTLVSGLINGINKVFVWNHPPLIVFWGVNKVVEGAASNGYTLSGVVTTFTDAPFTGETVEAYGNF